MLVLYDFICKNCKKEFEELIQRDHRAICPDCGSTRTIKLPGTPLVMGEFRKGWNKAPKEPSKVFMTDKRKKRGF